MDYSDYIYDNLKDFSVDSLIKLSRELFKRRCSGFKYVKITEANVRKLFDIQKDDSIITIVDKILETCNSNGISSGLDSGFSTSDAIYVCPPENDFCVDCKEDMLNELIEVIEDDKSLNVVNKTLDLNLKTEEEFEDESEENE